MKLRLVSFAIAALLASPAYSMLYVLNPENDGILDGTNISGYYPHIILSAPGTALNDVFSTASYFSGLQVFGYDDGLGPSPSWQHVNALRGDFSAPVDWVSVSFETDTSPILEIFDSSDMLLGSVTGTVGNVTLTLADPNIAYFIARAPFMANDQGDIWEIQFNVVPEPSSLALAGLGALVAGAVAWRRRAST